jgi:hypothetical protein
MADFKQSREGEFVRARTWKEGEPTEICIGPRKPLSELTVKLDVDASDAIRALKALQREARKATQALRELESEASRLEAEVAKAKTTNITVNIPNITVKDDVEIDKFLRDWRELAQKHLRD